MTTLAKHIRGSLFLVRRDLHAALVDLSRFENSTGINSGSGEVLGPDEISNLVSECEEDLAPLSEDDHEVLKDILLVDPKAARPLKALSAWGLENIFSDLLGAGKKNKADKKKEDKRAKEWLAQVGPKVTNLEKALQKNQGLSDLLENALLDGTVTNPETLKLLDQYLKAHPDDASHLTEDDLKDLDLGGEKQKEKDPDPTPVLMPLDRFVQLFKAKLDPELVKKLAWVKPENFAQTLKDLKIFLPAGVEVGVSSAETKKDADQNFKNRVVHLLFRTFEEQYQFIKKYKLIKGDGAGNNTYSTKPVIRMPATTSPSK